MQCEVGKWSECFYVSLSSVLVVFTLSLIINTKGFVPDGNVSRQNPV